MVEITQELVAENLLWGLWRSITEDYKEKYFKDVWNHFENAVKAASYTEKLTKFVEMFKRRIPCELQAKYTKDILSIVQSGKDYEVLTWLREETTYLIMLVRLRNQERKELLNLNKTQ